MWNYLARRILQMIPIIIGVSIILFLIINLVPGNFIDSKVSSTHMTPQQIQHLKDIYGINDPIYLKYFKWVIGAIHFDFGDSFTYQKPVSTVINTYVWNSFSIALAAFILELIIAIPIGIISATRQYSKTDMIFTFLALIGISFPSFFLGYILIKVFAVNLHILPLAGLNTPGSSYIGFEFIIDRLKHMILPVLVLALISAGSMMRYTRTAVLEIVKQDYIRTARAKGLSEKVVIYKHALRNALIPIVTLIGLSLPGLFSGAIITESIFGIPGIGKIALEAVTKRDYPLLMGFSLFVAVLTLLGNLLSDIFYAIVDPRVKLK
ncbi:ABC transporter permease [Ruminiclostridium cellulolyticum]|uniref:Binding-protein-dependent transport systems inner membrane component n=1 Tax=Ruminiclostridium cellulolyticum (strain ATCC 35319 / DSM 5812 / JCM 6584 / H10) TaxID=394503 RepID=B8I2X5_RUMCH|nr:ABC transporter permease [Ruminiclostridium cellulolyticum]ACL76118.1 binding-protein-dependent transport systems inner membrane component [Ruminiclostridium cellulolyticum H10]